MRLQVEWKTVDPDQLASKKPADLDLHCFQNRLYPGSAWLGLIHVYIYYTKAKYDCKNVQL